MSASTTEQLAERYRELTTLEVAAILAAPAGDFTPAAIEAARTVLSERKDKPSEESMHDIVAQAQAEKASFWRFESRRRAEASWAGCATTIIMVVVLSVAIGMLDFAGRHAGSDLSYYALLVVGGIVLIVLFGALIAIGNRLLGPEAVKRRESRDAKRGGWVKAITRRRVQDRIPPDPDSPPPGRRTH